MASGILYLSKLDPALTDTAQLPKSSIVFLVVVGAGALIISFMGCWGAVRESPALLCSFSAVILILLLAELVAAALIIKYSGDFEQLAKEGLMDALKNRNNTAEYNAIDDIQMQLHCCGVQDSHDYSAESPLPASCCPPADRPAPETCPLDKAYQTGCWPALDSSLGPVWQTVAAAGIVVAVIQVAAVVGSCCLARAFRREYDIV